MSYPVYSYSAEDGQRRPFRESRPHIFEIFEPGQKVEIIISPPAYPRLAGFYSLYFRDLAVLVLGLCFILAPLVIGRVAIPSLETEAGMGMAAHFRTAWEYMLSSTVGPICVGSFLKGIA